MPTPRPHNPALAVASSTRLGIALLAAIALYTAAATIPLGPLFPALGGTPHATGNTVRHLPAIDLTEAEYHRSPVLIALAAALAGNLLLATFLRIPRTRRKLHVHAAHAGILVITLGGVIHATHAINLTTTAFDHQRLQRPPTALTLFDRERTALTIDAVTPGAPPQTTHLGLDHIPRYTPSLANTAAAPLATVQIAGVTVAVTDFVPSGVRSKHLVADPAGVPGVKLTTLINNQPVASTLHLAGTDDPTPEALPIAAGATPGVVVIDPAGVAHRTLALAAASTVPSTPDGAVLIRTTGDTTEHTLVALGDTAATPGLGIEWTEHLADRALVRVADAAAAGSRNVALRPYEPVAVRTGGVDPDRVTWVVWSPPPVRADGSVRRDVVFVGVEKAVLRDEKSSKIIEKPAPGGVIRVAPAHAMRIDAAMSGARADERVTPTTPEPASLDTLAHELEASWARVAVTPADGGAGRAVWVPFSLLHESPREVRVGGAAFRLTLGPVRVDREGPAFRLDGFEIEHFAGTRAPRDLRVRLARGEGAYALSLNSPAFAAVPGVGCAKLTLTGYDPSGIEGTGAGDGDGGVRDAEGGRYVVVRVTSTRGLWVVWCGFGVLALSPVLGLALAGRRGGRRRPGGVPARRWRVVASMTVGAAVGLMVVGVAFSGPADDPGGLGRLAVFDGERPVPMTDMAERFVASLGLERGERDAVALLTRAALAGEDGVRGERVIGVDDPALRSAWGMGSRHALTVREARGLVARSGGVADRSASVAGAVSRVAARVGLIGRARSVVRVHPDGAGWGAIGAGGLAGEVDRYAIAVRVGEDGVADDALATIASVVGAEQRAALGASGLRRVEAERVVGSHVLLWGGGVFGVVGAVCLVVGAAVGGAWRWLVWCVGCGAGGAGLVCGAVFFAIRGVAAGRVPVQNQWESVVALGVIAAAVGVVMGAFGAVRGRGSLVVAGGSGAGVGGLAMIAAAVGGAGGVLPGWEIEVEAGVLSTSWVLGWHVAAVLAGYAMVGVGSVCALGALFGRGALSRRFDSGVVVSARVGVWALGAGIGLGAWWADRAWGRWWAFDAKETWALVTWACVLAVLHVPSAAVEGGAGAGVRATRWRALLMLVSFVVMMWTYFGVNLLLTSLHAYG